MAAVVAAEQWLHHMYSGSRHSSSKGTLGKTYVWSMAEAVFNFNVLSM